jgi:glycosyltransferase involved in cell wall biosynthesis
MMMRDRCCSPFYHWIHSVPTGPIRDWWDVSRYGENHFLVYPGRVDIPNIETVFNAENYVFHVPHIVDAKRYFNINDDALRITVAVPELLTAEFAQVYPIAADRLADKGLRELVYTFSAMKNAGASVCLLIVDSWTGFRDREDIAAYRRMADDCGLTPRELVFASDIEGSHWRGYPRHVIRDLFMLSTVFVFTSKGESFGLVGIEAALCGAFPVYNASCNAMVESLGGHGAPIHFGGIDNTTTPTTKQQYATIAETIIHAARSTQQFAARTHIRRIYNKKNVYSGYYEPLLKHSRIYAQRGDHA